MKCYENLLTKTTGNVKERSILGTVVEDKLRW
jgi:hypothetical protein